MREFIKKGGKVVTILGGVLFLLLGLFLHNWNFIEFVTESISEIFTTTFVLFLLLAWGIDSINEKLDDLKKEKGV